jgi:hypothetical protein
MIEPGRWFQPMHRSGRTGSDELAVLDEAQQLLGVRCDAYATRRYAE